MGARKRFSKRLARGRSRLVLAIAPLFACGCALVIGIDDLPRPAGAPSPDASADASADASCDPSQGACVDACAADLANDPYNCGACGRTCTEDEVCSAGSCLTGKGCRDRVVHVSPGGDDNATGCAPSRPKRTITSAVDFVTASQLAAHEIHACAGTFVEYEVVMTWPVSLRGGYRCNDWTRPDDFPTGKSAETILLPDARQTTGDATLSIVGAAIGRSVLVDGLTIRGTGSRRRGLAVTTEAAPTIENNTIVGGIGASSQATGILTNSSPEIRSNVIDGGEGSTTTASAGSTGIGIFGGAAFVHDNVIGGGKGTTTSGTGASSLGIRLGSVSGLTKIERNTIYVRSGSTMTARMTGIEVAVTTSSPGVIELTENVVRMDPAQAALTCGHNGATACTSRGIHMFAVPGANVSVRVRRNRVHPGIVTPSPSAPSTLDFRGILASGDGVDAEITNNFVHSGGADGDTTGSTGRGLSVAGAKVTAVHNTIVVGRLAVGYGIAVQTTSAAAVTAENNLVLAATDTASFDALRLLDETSAVGSFKNNALVGPMAVLGYCTGGGCSPAQTSSIVTAETVLNQLSTGSASGNRAIRADCGGDPTSACIVAGTCGTAKDCNESVLVGWDEASQGASDLFGAGWKLENDTLCFIAEGGIDRTATTGPSDFFGTARTAPVSIGAHEQASCAQ